MTPVNQQAKELLKTREFIRAEGHFTTMDVIRLLVTWIPTPPSKRLEDSAHYSRSTRKQIWQAWPGSYSLLGKTNWQAALLASWHFIDASVIPGGVVDSRGGLEAHNFLHSSYNRYTCSWPSIVCPTGNIHNTFSSTLISYNGSLLHATFHYSFASHLSGE